MSDTGRSYTTRPAGAGLPCLRAAAALLALALTLSLTGHASAQQTLSSATLGGRVEDAHGGAVGGASVVVTNLGTNQRLSATTDEDGRFHLAYVPVGDYSLLVERDGFSPASVRLTLAVGQAADVRITLTVVGVAESVEVAAAAPFLDAARSHLSDHVLPHEIDGLPVNGRNYLDLALLLPGVSRANTGPPQRFAESSAVPGSQLSLSGQRNLHNSFLLDGLADNDQRHRLTVSGTLEAPDAGAGARAARRALAGFRLSYIFSYGSALPFNVLTGDDRNGDTNFNDRPVGLGRNTGRGFDHAALDLRLSRRLALTERVRVEFIIEGFNVLNRANLQVPNNIFGTGRTPLPSFGRATAAAEPRQIQFGLRLDF